MTALPPRLDRRGSAALEFGLTVPILLALMLGTIQAGIVFFAIAGLKHAIGEAARLATLSPARTDTEIVAKLRSSAFGINPANLGAPVITRGTAQGSSYAEITVSYTVPIDLFVLRLPSVTLQESRRAYIP